MKERVIVAIGGGSIRTKSTIAIDREIVRLSGTKRPSVAFLPTASSDSEKYSAAMTKYYGEHLGCRVTVVRLIGNNPDTKQIRKTLLSSDIIYVGGGNTLMMMKRWRYLGVDRMLRDAYTKGIVLCGVSAGSICWFTAGHSDSLSYYRPNAWKYILVRGLGLIKGVHCPHFSSSTLGVPRKTNFKKMIRKRGGKGIAIDDRCAVVFRNGTIDRVIAAMRGARAYSVRRTSGNVRVQPLN